MSKWIAATGSVSAETYGIDDKNDCCVRALANVTRAHYTWCHDLAKKKYGRVNGQGMSLLEFIPMYSECNVKLTMICGTTKLAAWYGRFSDQHTKRVSGMTIKTFLANCDKTKRYIVSYRGHNFAVINGKAVDSFFLNSNRYVAAVFEYMED